MKLHRYASFVRLPIDSGRELSDAEEAPLGGRDKQRDRGCWKHSKWSDRECNTGSPMM